MKKLILSLCSILFTLFSFAQEFPYEFSVLNEEYVELENPISLTNGDIWDDPELTIPLGFDFQFFDYTASNLYISSDFSYGTMLNTTILKEMTSKFLLPLDLDVIDAGYNNNESESEISYEVVGESPNRICKIQWSNCAFWDELDAYGTNNDRVNLQAWFFEGSNDFEFRYGSSILDYPEVNFPDYGVITGVIETVYLETGAVDNAYLLTGQTASPIVQAFSSQQEALSSEFFGQIPEEGTVYHFGYNFVSVSENDNFNQDIIVYPSVISDHLKFRAKEKIKYELYNLAGQVVMSGSANQGETKLETSHLESGVYIMNFTDGAYISTKRIIKP